MSISPITAHKRLENLEIAGAIAYADLCKVFPDRFVLPNFVLETRDDIRLNQARWLSMSESLADDQSRRVLDDLLSYRLTGDYRFMRSYKVRIKDQYFEDFLELENDEIFVDAGGFDGDTTEEFCRRCPNYGKVLLFEPSLSNLIMAKARLSRYRSIEFIQLGLSDTVDVLWFNPNAGSASSISKSGSSQINVTTLDEHVNSKVTLIKMDLEGWELNALRGSQRHIQEDHPALAISVYHHASDFWCIFEFVFSLRQDYKVFLRHYTEGWSETVMFFVPKRTING
jgi:FkbM family methyltransferase